MKANPFTVTWFATASLRLEVAGLALLFDPFVPLPGAANSLAIDDFLPAPHIFVTHGHFDHVASIPELVRQGGGLVYAPVTASQALSKQGVELQSLHPVSPGDELVFNAADVTPVVVKVKRGRHIRFDLPLVLSTLFSPRMLKAPDNVRLILSYNKVYRENNQTLVYEVSCGDTLITLLGSPSLDDNESYTQSPDLLILPFQGHTNLSPIALAIVKRLMPKAVMLHHFDDTFPPVSRNVGTGLFIKLMAERFPEIEVVVPNRSEQFSVG